MVKESKLSGETNVEDNCQAVILKGALGSNEMNQLLASYEAKEIRDINCKIFGEQILINLRQVIIDTLRWYIIVYEGEYAKFERGIQNLPSTIYGLFIDRLMDVYHLSFDTEHNILISVICNPLGISQAIQTNNPEISIVIKDGPTDHSTIEFDIKCKTNGPMKFDPLQQVYTICGMLSVIKPGFEYSVSEVSNLCGCKGNFVKNWFENVTFTYRPITYTQDEINRIETFFLKREKFLQIHYAIEKYAWVTKRDSSLDKMLFIVFSLELLFGKGDTVDSIQFKLMIRMINVLSEDTQIRKNIGERIKQIYNARSRVVHGFDDEKERRVIDDCLKNILQYQELLRIVIQRIIIKSHQYADHKTMLDEMDFNISKIENVDLSHIKWID